MMKKILKAALLCSVLSLGLMACSGSKPEEKTEKSETSATEDHNNNYCYKTEKVGI